MIVGEVHLDDPLLQEFAAGALDEPRLSALRKHLAQCRACRRKVTLRLKTPDPEVAVEGFSQLEQLGAGPLGRTYRAKHESGETVALKVLWAFNSNVGSTERALARVRSASALRHLGLVDVLGIGASTTNRPCIASELLTGRTLDAVIHKERLSRAELMDLLVELLHPVAALHRAGLVHGHLSASNVFVLEGAGERRVRLLDGALSYDEAATAADDLYAVGSFAFELLTGKAPGNAPSLPPLEPAGLTALLLQLLDPHGPSRPSADECLSTLRKLGAGNDQPVSPAGPARQLTMPAPRPPVVVPPPLPPGAVPGLPSMGVAPVEPAPTPLAGQAPAPPGAVSEGAPAVAAATGAHQTAAASARRSTATPGPSQPGNPEASQFPHGPMVSSPPAAALAPSSSLSASPKSGSLAGVPAASPAASAAVSAPPQAGVEGRAQALADDAGPSSSRPPPSGSLATVPGPAANAASPSSPATSQVAPAVAAAGTASPPARRPWLTRRRLMLLGGGLTLFWGARFGHSRVARPPKADRPLSAAAQELVAKAWQGLTPSKVLDTHVHLLGVGADQSGCYVNPRLTSPTNPWEYLKFTIYQQAAGVTDASKCDVQYLDRMVALLSQQPVHGRLLLLAFDQYHDADGHPVKELSEFYTPNERVLSLARRWPQYFVPCASVHPYREDALSALHDAVTQGAMAVKWLPNAMNIDPSSPRCDPFYEELANLGVPLITHAGEEKAVHAEELQRLGNPLLLRRALEHGVTVVVAHCASLGSNPDLDQPEAGRPQVDNFDLFTRLMREPQWRGRLFGDVSAMTLVNRVGRPLREVLLDDNLRGRMINGSDYPLPAINVLMQTGAIEKAGFLTADERVLLNEIDQHDPLLFDFVMKRCLKATRDGHEFRLPDATFMVRPEVFSRLS